MPFQYPDYKVQLTNRVHEKILNEWIDLAKAHNLPWCGELPKDSHPAMFSLQNLNAKLSMEDLKTELGLAIVAALF